MELELLSTVDPTKRLEEQLLDHRDAAELVMLEKRRRRRRRRLGRPRLSFALAVRKGRFAKYSLLIRSRYGVWSSSERRFIRTTDYYHYHHLTQGIRDLRDGYDDVLLGYRAARTSLGFLYRLFVVNLRRAPLVMRAQLLYYYAFMAKDRRMEEAWPDEYGGDDKREEVSALRHRVVDAYRRRMTLAQRLRVVAAYESDRRELKLSLRAIGAVILLQIIAVSWLLYRELTYWPLV